MARFNSIRGRMSGRGRGRNRHEHIERGNNYRGMYNSRGRPDYSGHPTHGVNGNRSFNHSKGKGGNNYDGGSSNGSNYGSKANVKCHACNEYGHYANKCPNRGANLSGNKRKAEEDA